MPSSVAAWTMLPPHCAIASSITSRSTIHSGRIGSVGSPVSARVLAGNVRVLVLDLRLPIMSGIEVNVELKRLKRAVPTVITGYFEEEQGALDTLRSMSVTGCLFKPFDPLDLVELVRNAAAPGLARADTGGWIESGTGCDPRS